MTVTDLAITVGAILMVPVAINVYGESGLLWAVGTWLGIMLLMGPVLALGQWLLASLLDAIRRP